MKINFKKIEYKSQDWHDAVKLREKILREPLGNKFSDTELEEEKYHIQIAGFLNNELHYLPFSFTICNFRICFRHILRTKKQK